MYTLNGDTSMPKRKTQNHGENRNFCLRLGDDREFERYKEILRRALVRNPLANKTKVNRELLGLESYGLLIERDVIYFRGKTIPSKLALSNNDEEKQRPRN